MKILAIGDSITLGKPGLSYIQFLKNYEIDNYGKAGDTIIGIYNRLKSIDLCDHDYIFIEGGGNDILLPLFYEERPLWRKVIDNIINSGSIPSSDIYEYISTWQDIIKYLKADGSKNIIVISNPILGENINNRYNKIVSDYNNELKKMCLKNSIKLIDFFSWQVENLSGNPKLMTNTPVDVERDSAINDIALIDELSQKRNYNLTIDGVHFNSISAQKLAELIEDNLHE